ncbi:MAG TPA: glyoxalase superfamily protein [Nitrosospira sp.]|nr:glyoxalase superfamily protein [Nitrosospira sp.]
MHQTVIPQLRIISATVSLPFYIEGLGFNVDWKHQFEPGFPLFMQLTRRDHIIFLTEHNGDCQVGGAVYFIVSMLTTVIVNLLVEVLPLSRRPRTHHGNPRNGGNRSGR